MNKFQVIATLNNHLLNPENLNEMYSNGATIFRINGSHISPPELKRYSDAIRSALGDKVKILIDLPGNKIRTAPLPSPIMLKAGSTFELHSSQLNYPGFLSYLKEGDVLLANDSLFKFRVESASAKSTVLFSFSDGKLTSNKGVHLTGRHPPLPFFFPRDHELIENAKTCGLDYLGLSFVRTAEDVKEARSIAGNSGLRLIVKVETAPAVENLDRILDEADEFLVDRGDLSCDVGIENVDYFQKFILRKAKEKKKKIYFATQFLHSMLENNVPLIAEVCGLANAIQEGVDGIQLSEETAIGKHPVEVLRTVEKIYQAESARKAPARSEKGAPIFWLTGRSGSGKTTIAKKVISDLNAMGLKACLVDGDDFRAFWGNDVGYTKEDRFRNLRTIIFTAFQASRSFDVVIVSSLSPYAQIRTLAREKLGRFHEIYVDCPAETCHQRDPKGHYKKASTGEHSNFIGVTEEYEVPANPDLVIHTNNCSPSESASQMKSYLLAHSR